MHNFRYYSYDHVYIHLDDRLIVQISGKNRYSFDDTFGFEITHGYNYYKYRIGKYIHERLYLSVMLFNNSIIFSCMQMPFGQTQLVERSTFEKLLKEVKELYLKYH